MVGVLGRSTTLSAVQAQQFLNVSGLLAFTPTGVVASLRSTRLLSPLVRASIGIVLSTHGSLVALLSLSSLVTMFHDFAHIPLNIVVIFLILLLNRIPRLLFLLSVSFGKFSII